MISTFPVLLNSSVLEIVSHTAKTKFLCDIFTNAANRFGILETVIRMTSSFSKQKLKTRIEIKTIDRVHESCSACIETPNHA